MKQGSNSKTDTMQLVSRFVLSGLIGCLAAVFSTLLLGSLLPQSSFSYGLEVSYAFMGAVFILAAGYAAPEPHRRTIALILVPVGTIAQALLDFGGDPLSFGFGAFLASAFHCYKQRNMEPTATQSTKKAISLRACIAFSLVQQAIVLVLGSAILDGGAIFQIVAYAAIAYWVCFALIMARRRRTLTQTDKMLIRWGYLALSLFVSPYITGLMWRLRGY